MSNQLIKEEARKAINSIPKVLFTYDGKSISDFVSIQLVIFAGKNSLVYTFDQMMPISNEVDIFVHEKLLEVCQKHDLGLLRQYYI